MKFSRMYVKVHNLQYLLWDFPCETCSTKKWSTLLYILKCSTSSRPLDAQHTLDATYYLYPLDDQNSEEYIVQCAGAERGKYTKAPPALLISFSANSFLPLKIHILLSILCYQTVFEKSTSLSAAAMLKKILKIGKS